jgi:hypothetical protein
MTTISWRGLTPALAELDMEKIPIWKGRIVTGDPGAEKAGAPDLIKRHFNPP